jgi:AAA15 family ATPase/GTPase
MEKLIINNFAGIEYLAIEIKKINILIGSQASGKSVCAKLLYYFKEFIRTLILRLDNDQSQLDFNSLYIQKFLDYFPPQAWSNKQFLIRYELNDDFIQISREDKNNFNLHLTYSENYTKLGIELKELLSTLRQKQLGDPNLIFFKGRIYNNQVMFKHCQDKFGNQSTFFQIFIPAGRSFLLIYKIIYFLFYQIKIL